MNFPPSKKSFFEKILDETRKIRQEIRNFLSDEPKESNKTQILNLSANDNLIIDVTNQNYKIPKTINDNSIIDVTNQTYKITNDSSIQNTSENLPTKVKVPHWEFRYIYPNTTINSGTYEQKLFYTYLKRQFLNKIYVDVEGNSNYYFILLFDLVNDYEKHRNIRYLEQQIQLIGEFYPNTISYGVQLLAKKMELIGDIDGAERIRFEHKITTYDAWKLGSKYKKTLNLSNDAVKFLNRIDFTNNNFNNLEFCGIEIVKLYFSLINKLNSDFAQEGSSFDEQLKVIADLISRKHFRYRLNSKNYKDSLDSSVNEVYSLMFKYTENAVREHFGHKRKLNIDVYYSNKELLFVLKTRILERLQITLENLISGISQPDEKTEVALNTQNTSRWKIYFEKIKENYTNDTRKFVDDIVQLARLNKNNPSVENIFFESAKFIASFDTEATLTLYVHYLYHDLKSTKFDNKQLNKSIQKKIFKNAEQKQHFDELINELTTDRNLESALQKVSEIYAIKRKKIKLDLNSIKEVQKQHSGTVQLLNTVLNDEFESFEEFLIPELESLISFIETKKFEEASCQIETEATDTSMLETDKIPVNSKYKPELNLSQIRQDLLMLFFKSNFSVLHSDIEEFAKMNGVFKNQLIDSINENCYELLDDILIEEEDDSFTIYQDYYQKLLL